MKRGYFWLFFLLLALGLIFSFASLYSSISLYKKVSGQSVNFFASQGEVSLTIEASNDTKVPSISIVDPTNTTYTSHRSQIRYTVSDNSGLDSCWYSLNSGESNVSLTCGNNVSGISSSEGGNVWIVYANDTSGNENLSSVSFFVDLSDAPASSLGGGGGGGGGAGGDTVRVKNSFEIDPKELNLVLVSGDHAEKRIMVRNTGDQTLFIRIFVTGVEEMVAANVNELILSPEQEEEVVLSIDSPESGIFAGRIIFESGDLREDVLVLLNTQSSDALFDVSLTIPESFRVIEPEGLLQTFVSLTQVGDAEEVDVIVDYVVKDFDGNTLHTESETFRVFREKSFGKDFDIFRFEPGDYIVGMEVNYPGGFATSSAHFTIAEPKVFLSPRNTLMITVVLALIVIIVIILEIIRYKRTKRYRRK